MQTSAAHVLNVSTLRGHKWCGHRRPSRRPRARRAGLLCEKSSCPLLRILSNHDVVTGWRGRRRSSATATSSVSRFTISRSSAIETSQRRIRAKRLNAATRRLFIASTRFFSCADTSSLQLVEVSLNCAQLRLIGLLRRRTIVYSYVVPTVVLLSISSDASRAPFELGGTLPFGKETRL